MTNMKKTRWKYTTSYSITTNNNNIAFSQHDVHKAQTFEVYNSVTVPLDRIIIPEKKLVHLYLSS